MLHRWTFDALREKFPRTSELFKASRYYSYHDSNDIAQALEGFFDGACNYVFHYDDVFKLPKRANGKAAGVYPKLTVKGRPANYGPEWFRTMEEARLHILGLAAYIFEEEQKILATT